jgi:hypothetical protein
MWHPASRERQSILPRRMMYHWTLGQYRGDVHLMSGNLGRVYDKRRYGGEGIPARIMVRLTQQVEPNRVSLWLNQSHLAEMNYIN